MGIGRYVAPESASHLQIYDGVGGEAIGPHGISRRPGVDAGFGPSDSGVAVHLNETEGGLDREQRAKPALPSGCFELKRTISL